MPKKPPLTDDEWAKVEVACHAAEASLGRVVSALLSSPAVAGQAGEWADVRSKAGDLADDLFRAAGRGRSTPSNAEATLRWFDSRRADPDRPAKFSQAEWAVIGDEVRSAWKDINRVIETTEEAFPKALTTKWKNLLESMGSHKHPLDVELDRQHKNWQEGRFVLHLNDKTLASHVELHDSLNMAEVASIRAF